jgi:hypothetical protein
LGGSHIYGDGCTFKTKFSQRQEREQHLKKPDVNPLRIFGSTAFIHISDALRRQLEPNKAVKG